MTRAEIEKLLEGTTPGPWQLEELCTVEQNGDETMDGVEVTAGRTHIHDHDLGYDDGPVDAAIYANASLIAAAPTLTRQLLAVMEAAQAAVDFYDGPMEAKRPDAFAVIVGRLRAALQGETT